MNSSFGIKNSQEPSAASPRPVVTHDDTGSKDDKAGTGAADGFLFLDDDLIRSILDLTRELQALGIIEIYRQPSGADAYRIVNKLSKPSRARQPTGDIVRRLGAIFRRRGSTLWSVEEIKAFKALVIDPGDLAVVEEYYRSEAGKEKSYTRTSLLTFLRHYTGEVDRARRWKETSARRHCY